MPRHIRPADLVRFVDLAGVPVHWGSWGRTGDRWLRPHFLALLERALSEVWATCPWGPAEGILSGGAYVPRDAPEPPARDRHQEGTAFDLSGIRWMPPGPTLLAYQALDEPDVYLAIEAILRKHIPQALDWWTNRDHRSHWHLDDRDGQLPFSPRSKADVLFVQAALGHVWDHPVAIDGVWGPQTGLAVDATIEELCAPRGSGLGTLDIWHAWLEATALKGFL